MGPAQVVLFGVDDPIAFLVHENTSDAVFAHPKAKLFGIGAVSVVPARGIAFVEVTSPRAALALGALDVTTTCILGQRLVVISELQEAGELRGAIRSTPQRAPEAFLREPVTFDRVAAPGEQVLHTALAVGSEELAAEVIATADTEHDALCVDEPTFAGHVELDRLAPADGSLSPGTIGVPPDDTAAFDSKPF